MHWVFARLSNAWLHNLGNNLRYKALSGQEIFTPLHQYSPILANIVIIWLMLCCSPFETPNYYSFFQCIFICNYILYLHSIHFSFLFLYSITPYSIGIHSLALSGSTVYSVYLNYLLFLPIYTELQVLRCSDPAITMWPLSNLLKCFHFTQFSCP